MGSIVAGMGSCHAPALFLRQPGEDPAQLDATIAAMRRLGQVLDETKPDALIVLGLDHLEAFSLDITPMFAVVVGPEVTGSFGPKQYRVPVDQELARTVLEGAILRGFDVAFAEQAFMGHAFVVPFEFILGERQIPVVPIFVNVYVPPLPQPQRCYDLGRTIAEIIGTTGKRVAVLSSGGMSHFPGTDRYGSPEFDFDHWLLGVMEAGEQSRLLSMTTGKLDDMGETELLTWYALFGAIGDRPAEVLTYQPTWHHGLGVVNFPIATPQVGAPAPVTVPTEREGSPTEYRYYKAPTSATTNLNRLLYDLRMHPPKRQELVRDMDGVMSAYGLSPEQTEALKSLEPLTVAQIGAHPILAWTAVQMVQADIRAGRIG